MIHTENIHQLPVVSRIRGASTEKIVSELGIQGASLAIDKYVARIAGRTREERLSAYNSEKAQFEAALSAWKEPYRSQLRDVLEASRFVDWEHMAPEIMKAFRSRGRLSVLNRELHLRYNRAGRESSPEFENMRGVKRFLAETDLPPGIERLLKVHQIAMSGKVEGIRDDHLGVIRQRAIGGIEITKGLTREEIGYIEGNPYLSFEKARGLPNGRSWGFIRYPEPVSVKESVLKRISAREPELVSEIREFKFRPIEEQVEARKKPTAEFQSLTRRLVTALIEERYETFASKIERVGALATRGDVLKYIQEVAFHYRDLVSIHPFENGNGRTIRYESLYAPLDHVGISRPRLSNPNQDILCSPSEWLRHVHRGIVSTDLLYRDMTERINHGLRVENSPELVLPNALRECGIELRVRGRKFRTQNIALQAVAPSQFGAYVDARLGLSSKLAEKFVSDPLLIIQKLREDFKQFVKSNVVLCYIPKRGIRQVGLQLVDFDVRSVFGVTLSHDTDRWKNKIERWHTSKLNWRGMCGLQEEMSTADALRLFTKFDTISLPNSLLKMAGAGQKIVREAIQAEFDRYNRDLIHGHLYRRVIAHVEAKSGYLNSYGCSTSRRWGSAAGFAWGRGTLGYDKESVRAAQHLVKARVLIGARQSIKDVDVRRFSVIDRRFSYKFGRQQEILAIGGIDPDAIMVVQFLDARRKITKSFVRNPNRPAEVWEIDGGFHPDSAKLVELPKDVVLAKHQLFS